MKKQARNPMLEAMRGIACIFVVFVHFRLQNSLQQPFIAVARFAVPFFLILSGYFSYKKSDEENAVYLKKQLKGALKLTLVGVIVSSIANIASGLIDGSGAFKWLTDALTVRTIMAFIFLNWARTFSQVMYYLFMLIYDYCILILLNKKSLLDKVYFLIPLLLTANILITHIMRQPDYWVYAGNFLLTGLPFLLLGRYICYRKITIKSMALLILSVIAGVVITVFELRIFGECYCYVGTLFISIGLFILCIGNPQLTVPRFLSGFGTKYSTLLFLLHCPVGYVLVALFDRYSLDFGSWTGVIVIIATLIVIEIYFLISSRLNKIESAK